MQLNYVINIVNCKVIRVNTEWRFNIGIRLKNIENCELLLEMKLHLTVSGKYLNTRRKCVTTYTQ